MDHFHTVAYINANASISKQKSQKQQQETTVNMELRSSKHASMTFLKW